MIPALLASSLLGFSAFSSIFSVYVLSGEGKKQPRRPALQRMKERQELLLCRVQALENVYNRLARWRPIEEGAA